MKPEPASDITLLLRAWNEGEASAQEKLWPIVFAELKRLARRQLASERPDHTLQSAALVNEAYLHLIDWNNRQWVNRGHFFAMCSRMMRQILVDYARARQCGKRPSQGRRLELDDVILVSEAKGEELLALDEALK